MPLKGFACPPQAPTAGERHEVSYCMSQCVHPCAAPPLLQAIHASEQANHHQGTYISTTMLAGASCPRQTWLERRHDFYEHPLRRYWAFRGTHAHSIIEAGANEMAQYGWLQELRLAVPVTYPDLPAPIFDAQGVWTGKFDDNAPLVITIGGTIDAYNAVIRAMWDFKSAADAKADMFVRGQKGGTFRKNLEDRWVWQTNIYRWLLTKTPIPADYKAQFKLKGKRFPDPQFIGIQVISMMEIPRSGMPYRLRGRDQEIHTVDDVPLLPLKEVEEFVRKQALPWYKWLVLGKKPPVVKKNMAWLCKSCCFNGELVEGGVCLPSQERTE